MSFDPKNLKQLLSELEQTLFASIPTTIEQLRFAERAYCVLIVYSDTNSYDDFRPRLLIGPESLRGELLEENPDALEILWNPGLLDEYAEVASCFVDGPRLKQACTDVYRALIGDPDGENPGEDRDEQETLAPVREAMHRLAVRLNQRDWSQTLETTDDFVVVAIDDWGWDPQADLTACAPPERLELLDSRGHLRKEVAACPECGGELRSAKAKQCFECGENWR